MHAASVLDIMLRSLARRLSLLREQRAFRIVAVSGWGEEMDRQRSAEAGFDLHLVKPVEAHVLARVVSQKNGEPVR